MKVVVGGGGAQSSAPHEEEEREPQEPQEQQGLQPGNAPALRAVGRGGPSIHTGSTRVIRRDTTTQGQAVKGLLALLPQLLCKGGCRAVGDTQLTKRGCGWRRSHQLWQRVIPTQSQLPMNLRSLQ